MSSKSGKGKEKISRQSKQSHDYDDWSDWTWDPQRYLYYRARYDETTGQYQYRYETPVLTQGASEASETPRTSSVSSNVGRHDAAYSEPSPEIETVEQASLNYKYETFGQPSSTVDTLADSLRTTSLSEGNNQEEIPPLHHREEYSASSQTQPIIISGALSRSSAAPGYTYSLHSGIESGGNEWPASGYGQESTSGYGHSMQGQYVSPGTTPLASSTTPYQQQSTYSSSSTSWTASGSDQQPNIAQGSGSTTTTPKSSHKTITGTPGEKEALDSRFRVQNSRHFIPGHIFMILWSEPYGSTAQSATDVTTATWETKYGELVHSTIRRFVIISTGNGHSQCLPILTYGHQGTTKSGINRDHHAVIYMDRNPPKLLRGEEELTREPIQCVARSPRDKLLPDSRINYAKIYTVEHNVKVHFIGQVAKDSRWKLMSDFDEVWESRTKLS